MPQFLSTPASTPSPQPTTTTASSVSSSSPSQSLYNPSTSTKDSINLFNSSSSSVAGFDIECEMIEVVLNPLSTTHKINKHQTTDDDSGIATPVATPLSLEDIDAIMDLGVDEQDSQLLGCGEKTLPSNSNLLIFDFSDLLEDSLSSSDGKSNLNGISEDCCLFDGDLTSDILAWELAVHPCTTDASGNQSIDCPQQTTTPKETNLCSEGITADLLNTDNGEELLASIIATEGSSGLIGDTQEPDDLDLALDDAIEGLVMDMEVDKALSALDGLEEFETSNNSNSNSNINSNSKVFEIDEDPLALGLPGGSILDDDFTPSLSNSSSPAPSTLCLSPSEPPSQPLSLFMDDSDLAEQVLPTNSLFSQPSPKRKATHQPDSCQRNETNPSKRRRSSRHQTTEDRCSPENITTVDDILKLPMNKNTGLYHCPFPDCSISQARRYNLKIHYMTHLGATSRVFSCPECQRGFRRRFDMKRHRLSRHHVPLNSPDSLSESAGQIKQAHQPRTRSCPVADVSTVQIPRRGRPANPVLQVNN